MLALSESTSRLQDERFFVTDAREADAGEGMEKDGAVAEHEKQSLDTMRHSAAHVMAAAVERLFPGTKLGIGPTIENGFYYDMDVPQRS